jgi:hypothetical protein
MNLSERTVELINADVDGEISSAGKIELNSILASSPDARRYHSEMAGLLELMNSADRLEPPKHLRHLIMDSVSRARHKAVRKTWRPGLRVAPALRLVTAFAAGVVLTWSFVSSDSISRNAFEDVTSLVGTMSDDVSQPGVKGNSISHADVAGAISLRKSGNLLVIDFDLVSDGPMDVIAGFAKADVWFNGFAQLESSDTSVSAEPGRVTIRMKGKQRYALYLHDSSSKLSVIDLQFVSSGRIVHEARLAPDMRK